MFDAREFLTDLMQRLTTPPVLAGLILIVALVAPGWISVSAALTITIAGFVTLSLLAAVECRRRQLARLRARRIRSRH